MSNSRFNQETVMSRREFLKLPLVALGISSSAVISESTVSASPVSVSSGFTREFISALLSDPELRLALHQALKKNSE